MSTPIARYPNKSFTKQLDVSSTLSHLGSDVIRESSGIIPPKKKVLPDIKSDIESKDSIKRDQQKDNTVAPQLQTVEYQIHTVTKSTRSISPLTPEKPYSDTTTLQDIPPTKIPEKYHIIDHHPIRPKNDDGIVYGDAGWVRKWFPSDKPGGRREVTQLARTFDAMLAEIAEENTIYSIEKEQQVYDIILHEIIRQVSVECADRGKLLEGVSKRYKRLFARIPSILSELQQEIDGLVDANKSLRMLLERLMEEKSIIEHQLKDTKFKDDNLSEQNNSFSAEIQRYKKTIQHLIEEKDAAVEEAKRQQERHHYQERLNAELQDRDEFNKSIIKKMGEQLEDAINSLHEMEAKYLGSIAQNRTARAPALEGQSLEDAPRQAYLNDELRTKNSKSVREVPSTPSFKLEPVDSDDGIGIRPKSAPAELCVWRPRPPTTRQQRQKSSTPKKKHTYSPGNSTPASPSLKSPLPSTRTRPSPSLTSMPHDKRRDLLPKT